MQALLRMGETMSKRDNEREKARSAIKKAEKKAEMAAIVKANKERMARKKAEIDAEVNDNRELVYNYVASRKDVVGKTCVEELKFFEKGKRYLEWLSLNGYLSRMLRAVNNGKRMYVYNAITPYVKPVIVEVPQETQETQETQKDANEIVYGVARVIRLLDRPQIPRDKSDKVKKSGRGTSSMQSSMNMFGSW